jgi:hypothetical protein
MSKHFVLRYEDPSDTDVEFECRVDEEGIEYVRLFDAGRVIDIDLDDFDSLVAFVRANRILQ